MPKINVTDAKGLFQNTGTGIEFTRGTANTSSATTSSKLSFDNLYERVTLDSDTETNLTTQLPAGAIVLGGNITVVTADGNAISITDVGSVDGDNDDDKYSGTIAVDAQTVGATATFAPSVVSANAAATTVGITHGSASGAGVVDVNIFYISVA